MKELQVNKLDEKFLSKNRNITISIKELLALCVPYPTQLKLSYILEQYTTYPTSELLLLTFGKVLVGIMGLKLAKEKVIIKHIAISPYYRKQGIGSKVIKMLPQMYQGKIIEVETDSNIVKFFKKSGFIIQEIKNGSCPTKFFLCTLKIQKTHP
jgi:N-acetylglutamate synthase-like GNAT family acetyltransferase